MIKRKKIPTNNFHFHPKIIKNLFKRFKTKSNLVITIKKSQIHCKKILHFHNLMKKCLNIMVRNFNELKNKETI